MTGLDGYAELLGLVKSRIAGAQVRAAVAANRELLTLHWELGRLIADRQAAEGWGAAVVPRLAHDLQRDLPGATGFSERNLRRMVRFFREYPRLALRSEPGQGVSSRTAAALPSQDETQATGSDVDGAPFLPRPVAEIEGHAAPPPGPAGLPEFLTLPWGHHVLLFERVPDLGVRAWYVRQCVQEGWSRDVLGLMLKSEAHRRQGAATTNFEARLPAPHSDLAQQTLKDPYVFDFLALDAGFRERELERGLVAHTERFLLELGVGFAFVGRQVHIALGEDDFYLDLLFYHLTLRCFVVIDLKVGPFRAEDAGQMNLYLNLVDDTLRQPTDQPSIGLILCQDKKRILAEYALRGMDKPIGVSEYELTRALPAELASSLPTVAALEDELAGEGEGT